MGIKKFAVLVMALIMCLTAVSAMAATEATISGASNADLNKGYETLQAAFDQLNADSLGDAVIVTLNVDTYTGNFTIKQHSGTNVIVKGNGATVKGTIEIHGMSRNTGTETLAIEDLNFDMTGLSSVNQNMCIGQDDASDSERRYPHNLTVRNCTFKGNGNNKIMAVRLRQSYGNIQIINCTADGLYGLYWGKPSNHTLTIDNAQVTNAKEGINETAPSPVTIKNSSIEASDLAIRVNLDQGSGQPLNLKVENNTIDCPKPIILRGNNDATNNTYDVTGNTFVGMTPDQIDQVITVPSGVTITGNLAEAIEEIKSNLKNNNKFVFNVPASYDLPQTGDNTSLLLWSGLLALAAAGFVASRKVRFN